MMPKIHRLNRRFFTVLISLSLAFCLPRIAFAGGGAKGPTLCQISDTIYRADGSPAQGTVLISWESFTTSAGQAVTPGSLLVTLDASGGFNASLAPNTGASPAGTYYKAIFKLNDGTTETEFWVVPNTQTTTIGAIRSKLVPAQQAAQFLTRDYADSTYVGLASTQTISGVKTFSASPAVPTPQNPTDAANKSYVDNNSGGGTQLLGQANTWSGKQTFSVSPAVPTPQNSTDAANKSYVDANSGSGNLASPPPIGNVTPNSATFTTLTEATNNGICNAGFGATTANGANDIGAKALACWAACSNQCTVYVPAGSWKFNPFTVPYRPAHLLIDPGATLYPVGSSGYGIDTQLGTSLLVGTIIDGHGTIDGTYFTGGSALLHLQPSNGTVIDLILQNLSSGDCIFNEGANTVSLGTTYTRYCKNGLHQTQKEYNSACYAPNGVSWSGGGETVFNTQWGLWEDAAGYLACGYPAIGNTYSNVFEGNGSGVVATTSSGNYAASAGSVSITVASGAGIHQGDQVCIDCLRNSSSTAGETEYVTSISGNVVTVGKLLWAHNGTSTPFPVVAIHGGNAFVQLGTNIVFSRAYFENHLTPNYGFADIIFGDNSIASPCGVSGCIPNGSQVIGTTFLPGTSGNVNASVLLANGIDSIITNSTNYGASPFGVNIVGGNLASVINFQCAACNVAPIGGYSALFGTVWSRSLFFTPGIAQVGGNLYISGNAQVLGNIATPTAIYTNSILPNSGTLVTVNGNLAVGDLSARDIPGHEYFVSKYASIQAAINAAYNNGAVLGTVIDDRTTPYTGAGFFLYDSVTLKLAATTYTITSTVTYNNGNNNVTAGIIAIPGGRLIGASTSTNHGTIITAGNGLNADLIATSTVGTGIAAAAQWWHWGGFENLRVMGNGANQTAGNCFNIENMGEVAFLRSIEVSGCYLDNILFTGASATPSDMANITTNSAGRYGFNFNNLAGVAVVHGLSGDSNTTSLVRLNGGQSGTLTILGFKTEEEVSGQDPLITIDQTGEGAAQPSLFIVGGYTFGRNGVNDVIKYVNGVAGTTPYISVSNFYVQDYVNAVNDTVNGRTTAASNMNKVPFYYGPTGAFYSGQAFTLDLNTFVQSPHSGNYTLTEVFGTTSSNETLVAASGTSSSLSVGGIGFRMPNRSIYGQTPELFAKMTYAFPNGVPNTQQWEFIPAKVGGDNSTRWIGDPSYRWDEIYSADVNSTTATIGTLNVTTCNGCGGSFQQVNSDWNASSGAAQILNKPALAAVATSGSYNDLSSKPALATVATSGSYNDLSSKPAMSGTGACGANQFETSDNVGAAPTCAQVQYTQLGGTPTTSHIISGTMQGQTAQITGTGSYATLYSATIPAGTASAGTGLKCRAYFRHSTGSGTVTMQWKLGSTSQAYATTFTGGNSGSVADIEIFTPSSTNSEIVDIPYTYFGGTLNGPATGLAWSENLTNANTVYLQFNVAATDKLTGDTFYCQTVQ